MTETGENRILVVGAGEHNLRIDRLEIPRGTFVVVSGPSGSGKSSLIFDTLYPEAVRRSAVVLGGRALSVLRRIERPRVERIDNVSYPIALKPRLSSARLTSFASLARLFPLIRALFAQLSERHCPYCGALLSALELHDVLERLRAFPAHVPVTVLGPVSGGSADRSSRLAALASRGFTRIYSAGALFPIEDAQFIEGPAEVDLVIDSFKWSAPAESRLIDAVQTALQELGAALVLCNEARFTLSTMPSCTTCGRAAQKISAEHFNYFSPQYACESCSGFGQIVAFEDQELLYEGRFASWTAVCPEAEHAGSLKDLREALVRYWRSSADARRRGGIEQHGSISICDACGGARVRAGARACRLGGLNFGELFSCDVSGALRWAESLLPFAGPAAGLGTLLKAAQAELTRRLQWLAGIGLGYLALNRSAASLSSGELYRAELSRYLARPLSGLLCLLDEPASGLHPRDLELLLTALRSLVDNGNSLVLVEHHPLIIRAAQYLIELGPGGGSQGGTVTAAGTPDALRDLPGPTGRILRGEEFSERRRRTLRQDRPTLTVTEARKRNLKIRSVGFPHGAVSAVAGVSGSGKSTLVFDSIGAAVAKLIEGVSRELVSKQTRIGALDNWDWCSRVVDSRNYARSRSRRSTVATAVGIMPALRTLYARTRAARIWGLNEQNFSFNSPSGWCERCRGLGSARAGGIAARCSACHGTRFNKQVRLVDYRGLTLPELLSLTVSEAAGRLSPIFGRRSALSRYVDFGLGYLRLDHSAAELSLGERQRVRLVSDIGQGASGVRRRGRGHTLYLFDEPCRGLHVFEVERLLDLLFELADEGHTVIAVEHHPNFLRAVDFVVELGPGAGEAGGEVVFSGPARCFDERQADG